MCFAGVSLKSSLHKIFLLAFTDPLTAVCVSIVILYRGKDYKNPYLKCKHPNPSFLYHLHVQGKEKVGFKPLAI